MRKTIRSLRKRDVAVLGGITAALLIAIFVMTGTTNLYGSIIGWVSQHSVLPEYYRQTFYETGEFLPEFALQLGGGQYAYYFGYYGFLNPVYLPSYLMPGVSMVTYLQFASVVMLIASMWLGFLWPTARSTLRRRCSRWPRRFCSTPAGRSCLWTICRFCCSR